MLHLLALVQKITNFSKNSNYDSFVKDYGYWGDIRDTNSEFYILQNPYENASLYQYGYWGFIQDNNAKIVTNESIYRLRTFNLKSISDDRTYKFKFEAFRQEKISSNRLNEDVLVNATSLNSNKNIQKICIVLVTNLKSTKNLQLFNEQLVNQYNPIKIFIGNLFNNDNDTIKNLFSIFKFQTSLYGTHDLIKNNLKKIEQTLTKLESTVWLMSNIFDVKKQHLPITKCSPYFIIQTNDIKIGFIGLLYSDDVALNLNFKYVDYLNEANRLSLILRKCGCNLIVALTQMNKVSVDYLAKHANDIDVILSNECNLVDEQEKEEEEEVINVNNRWIIGKSSKEQIYMFNAYFDKNQFVDISISKLRI